MLTVRLFARLREDLGTGELSLGWSAPATVGDVIERLGAQGGEAQRRALAAENMVIAVNHSVSSREQVLEDGDELAFFPPVTGG